MQSLTNNINKVAGVTKSTTKNTFKTNKTMRAFCTLTNQRVIIVAYLPYNKVEVKNKYGYKYDVHISDLQKILFNH